MLPFRSSSGGGSQDILTSWHLSSDGMATRLVGGPGMPSDVMLVAQA